MGVCEGFGGGSGKTVILIKLVSKMPDSEAK